MKVGGFELGERLGAGAMGEVFAATHLRSGFPAAVKLVTRERDREAFEREVRAVAALDHPHVVWVLDHGVTPEGVPWLAMQRAQGTLETRVGAPWEDVRRALAALLDGLAHAHARGLVHGDLKPANVLLGCRRDPSAPLRDAIDGLAIADFGLARPIDELSRRVGGTPGFAAPECVQGGEIGPWSDLYAVGCTAWMLLTGTLPVATFRPVVEVPDGVGGWLGRLLHPEPEARYRCAAEALQGLLRIDPLPGRTGGALDVALPSLVTTRAVLAPVLSPVDVPTGPLPPRIRGGVPATWERECVPWPAIAMLDAGLSLLPYRTPELVGRRAERDALWSALREVERTGRAHVVQLTGPVGSGRERLARWLTRRVLELGVAVVSGSEPDPTCDGLQVVLLVEPDLEAVVRVEREVVRQAGAVLWLLAGGATFRAPERSTVIVLGPLPPHEHEALMRAVLPLEPGLSLDLAARTAGNPGEAVAAVRDLVARGALVASVEGYRLASGSQLVPVVSASRDDEERLRALDEALEEGRERRRLGDRRGAAEVARRAWSLVDALGIPSTEIRHVEALTQLVSGGAGTLAPDSHVEKARTLIRLARAGGFWEQEFYGRFQLAMLLVEQPGTVEERVGELRSAADLGERNGRSDLAVKAWYQLGYEALFSGDSAAAEALFRRCLDVGSPVGLHFGGMGLCDVLLRRGRGEEALASARRAVDADLVARRHEAAGTLGCALIDLGRPAEAEAWTRTGLDAARAIGSPGYEMRMLLNLGHIHQTMGRDAEAESSFLRGIELSRITGQSDLLCRANLCLLYLRSSRFGEGVQLMEPLASTPTGRVDVDLYVALLWLAARLGAGVELEVGAELEACRAAFAEHGRTNASCIEVTERLVDLLAGGAQASAASAFLEAQRSALP